MDRIQLNPGLYNSLENNVRNLCCYSLKSTVLPKFRQTLKDNIAVIYLVTLVNQSVTVRRTGAFFSK